MSDRDPVLTLPAREGYDLWAAVYDQEDNPLIALEEPEVDRRLGGVDGLRVADLGCGTGRHSVRLAERGARVSAIDFSEAMLSQARGKVARAGLEAAVEFRRHDLAAPLPLESDSFDRVLCCLALEHVAELPPVFAEMGRICRPGGRIIVSEMHPAMLLKGVSAHFHDPKTGRDVRPASQGNQISDYMTAAVDAGLGIFDLSERFVDEELTRRSARARKHVGWPLLLMLTLEP